jgi:hypothetical protein
MRSCNQATTKTPAKKSAVERINAGKDLIS